MKKAGILFPYSSRPFVKKVENEFFKGRAEQNER